MSFTMSHRLPPRPVRPGRAPRAARAVARPAPPSGFTLVELLTVMGIIAVLLAILLPALGSSRRASRQLVDATRLRQVHTAFLSWSRAFNGLFPTPGLINRLGTAGELGAEDVHQNSHANLYSASIAQNYFSAQLCVSAAESNANVLVHASYNYNAYNVTQESFWDPTFRCDLATVSNLSFATLHLDGPRKAAQWRESLDSRFAVVGNRGVKDGSMLESVYNASKTLAIHGGARSWEGNIVYNDNHVAFESVFSPPSLKRLGPDGTVADNLFRDDPEGAGADVWLTMISAVAGAAGGGGVSFTLSWD